MPKFRFAVRSPEGKLRTGSVTEATLDAARQRLKGAGFVIVSLAEEAELVIPESKATASALRGPKPKRAAIIEFETTFSERLGNFFSRFILRKEFAILLFLVGIGLAGYRYAHRPQPPPRTEPKYMPFALEIEVEPGMAEGETFEAVLPDIPLAFSQKASEGNLLKYSFEALKQPVRVQVKLTDSSHKVLAEGEGLLSVRKTGLLVADVPLSPVKAKKP